MTYMEKKKKYQLVELDSNGNLSPKQYITKEKFLKMAYIISKTNSCVWENISWEEAKIGLQIGIFDKSCTPGQKNCKKSELPDSEGRYDFFPEIEGACHLGIKNIVWMLYNKDTKENVFFAKEYLDNYTLPSKGNWILQVFVEDNCGNTSSAQSFFSNTSQPLSLQIEASSTYGTGI